jgi:hypothetical protein
MKRILAVDDEPDILEIVKEVLPSYDIQTAATFQEATRLLVTETYDMVILDIMGVRGPRSARHRSGTKPSRCDAHSACLRPWDGNAVYVAGTGVFYHKGEY